MTPKLTFKIATIFTCIVLSLSLGGCTSSKYKRTEYKKKSTVASETKYEYDYNKKTSLGYGVRDKRQKGRKLELTVVQYWRVPLFSYQEKITHEKKDIETDVVGVAAGVVTVPLGIVTDILTFGMLCIDTCATEMYAEDAADGIGESGDWKERKREKINRKDTGKFQKQYTVLKNVSVVFLSDNSIEEIRADANGKITIRPSIENARFDVQYKNNKITIREI